MFKNSIIMFSVCILCLFSNKADAQINPLKSQYFANPFLFNPAKAGDGNTGNLATGISTQWDRVPGAPLIMSLTAEAPVSSRVGLGALVINDKAGVINRTVIMGTYSYKVPVSENSYLRFGLAAGYLSDYINLNDVVSRNINSDAAISNYNYQHENLLKAGFGAVFKIENLEIQSSWYKNNRLANQSNRTVDRSGITSQMKYSFGDPSGIVVSPMLGHRQIQGLRDYMDMGVNVAFLPNLDCSFIYHTNKTMTGGISYEYDKVLRLNCFYNSETPQIRGLTGGTFEMSLSMPFSLKHH